jgi:ATP-dependent Clp protease protease subunit
MYWTADDEEEKEEQPKSDLMMFSKKLEKYFFDKRSVYLWGVVDDKSARDVVSKLLLLDADKTGQEIKFYINSPGGVVTSGMVIYDTMKMLKSPVTTICMGLAASMGSILPSAEFRRVYPRREHRPRDTGQTNQKSQRDRCQDPRRELRKNLSTGDERF